MIRIQPHVGWLQHFIVQFTLHWVGTRSCLSDYLMHTLWNLHRALLTGSVPSLVYKKMSWEILSLYIGGQTLAGRGCGLSTATGQHSDIPRICGAYPDHLKRCQNIFCSHTSPWQKRCVWTSSTHPQLQALLPVNTAALELPEWGLTLIYPFFLNKVYHLFRVQYNTSNQFCLR